MKGTGVLRTGGSDKLREHLQDSYLKCKHCDHGNGAGIDPDKFLRAAKHHTTQFQRPVFRVIPCKKCDHPHREKERMELQFFDFCFPGDYDFYCYRDGIPIWRYQFYLDSYDGSVSSTNCGSDLFPEIK